jgi:hypothetical protein
MVGAMARSDHEKASEVAAMIARLVQDRAAFPDHAAEDLKRLLGHNLAAPPREARRWDNLALLAKVIVEREGLLPTASDYENARTSREADAPAASTLVKRYGHWLAALRAAANLISVEHHGQAPAEKRRHHPRYRPNDSAAALARCFRIFSTWPTQVEYTEWSLIRRRAARACGAPDPRLPAGDTVARHYGSFDRALAAAKSLYCGDSP